MKRPFLRSCPFCGHTAARSKANGMHVIECGAADCIAQPSVCEETLSRAIFGWNSRSNLEVLDLVKQIEGHMDRMNCLSFHCRASGHDEGKPGAQAIQVCMGDLRKTLADWKRSQVWS